MLCLLSLTSQMTRTVRERQKVEHLGHTTSLSTLTVSLPFPSIPVQQKRVARAHIHCKVASTVTVRTIAAVPSPVMILTRSSFPDSKTQAQPYLASTSPHPSTVVPVSENWATSPSRTHRLRRRTLLPESRQVPSTAISYSSDTSRHSSFHACSQLRRICEHRIRRTPLSSCH